MLKKIIVSLLIIAMLACIAGATSYYVEEKRYQGYKVEKVDIQNSGTGAFSGTTGELYGELLGLVYAKGNFTAGTNTITVKDAFLQTIDSYNVTAGNSTRVPGVKIGASTDAYSGYPLMGALTVSTTGGTAWKAATVYIIYR